MNFYIAIRKELTRVVVRSLLGYVIVFAVFYLYLWFTVEKNVSPLSIFLLLPVWALIASASNSIDRKLSSNKSNSVLVRVYIFLQGKITEREMLSRKQQMAVDSVSLIFIIISIYMVFFVVPDERLRQLNEVFPG